MAKNNYILVAGLGKSGVSIAKFLRGQGENVVATDIDPLRSDVAVELENIGVRTEIGFHSITTFENAVKIIVSPGIPLNNKYLAAAALKGIPISGELDIAEQFIDVPVVAITGTNGKTTVTTLISEMLKNSGLKVFTCGNIGTPIVDYFVENKRADVIVAEVSSFQLDTAENFSPDVAVLLNIAEDHMDRYADFSAYSHSKWSIFRNQSENDIAIINSTIQGIEQRIKEIKSIPVFFGKENSFYGNSGMIIKPGRLIFKNGYGNGNGKQNSNAEQGGNGRQSKSGSQSKSGKQSPSKSVNNEFRLDISQSVLKGWHNRENIAAASLAVLSLGADINIKGIESVLNSFKGLSHRMEYAGTINRVDYFDDSKATNPDAVVKALECFDNNVILILGGRSKDTDFMYMTEAVKGRVKKIIALGESGKEIVSVFSGICDVEFTDSMKQAVCLAYEIALPGDTVLLSPACASFDMYESYAARGDDFVSNVNAMKRIKV